jgi:cell division septation protein DedD
VLSDEARPTTALAAVKDANGKLIERPADPGNIEAAPPPATDRLPVVPLPAGSLLRATPVTTEPKDQLTAMASQVSEVNDDTEMAPAGNDSGYQIQVASFKDQDDADKLVADLRKRGHQAFRQAAYVPGRGLWHRVRIGPFDTKFQAIQYKKKFEAKERMSPFVVDPHEVKRSAEIRAAKLEARKRKYGRP